MNKSLIAAALMMAVSSASAIDGTGEGNSVSIIIPVSGYVAKGLTISGKALKFPDLVNISGQATHVEISLDNQVTYSSDSARPSTVVDAVSGANTSQANANTGAGGRVVVGQAGELKFSGNNTYAATLTITQTGTLPSGITFDPLFTDLRTVSRGETTDMSQEFTFGEDEVVFNIGGKLTVGSTYTNTAGNEVISGIQLEANLNYM